MSSGAVNGDVHWAKTSSSGRSPADLPIVSIVGVVALFGWLNRWNDTMATTLEQAPHDFAVQRLGGSGWEVGIHG